MRQDTHSGGCACGRVRYEAIGTLRAIIACHCEECRRSSGHFVAASAVHKEQLSVLDERDLHWWQSSEKMRRGFCGHCGSSLFFVADQSNRWSIAAGSLDDSSALNIEAHICVSEAAKYYKIDDDVPCSQGTDHAVPLP